MVSRGGRSKGCTNCRRRRVKCDETRPRCNRCSKRGLGCDGPKGHTFIHQNGQQDELPFHNEIQIINPTPTSQISLSAFQDDICLAYTRKVLLKGGPVELACNMVYTNRPGKHEDPGLRLLERALLSLSVTFFGNQHRQMAIQNRGYKQYGTVLGQLNTHLSMPGLQTSDQTILTALTCMLLEIFLPTGPNHFLKHLQGIETILEMRGVPKSPMPPTTLILIHGLRILSIMGGLVMARPCLYSRNGWNEIPCLQKGDAGQLRHEIFSLLADCTRFMGERDAVLTSNDHGARQSLIADLKSAFSKMESILAQWTRFNRNQMKDSASISNHFQVANSHSATIYMLYNATYICLLDILETLEPLPMYGPLRRAAAVKIIESLQLKTRERREGGSESNTIGFVATKVAWQALGGSNTPEAKNLARAVQDAVAPVFADAAWELDTTRYIKLSTDSPSQLLWNNYAEIAGLVDGVSPSQVTTDRNAVDFGAVGRSVSRPASSLYLTPSTCKAACQQSLVML